MQVLSPAAALEGSAIDQRTQSPGPQERLDASNGGTRRTVRPAGTDPRNRKIIFLDMLHHCDERTERTWFFVSD